MKKKIIAFILFSFTLIWAAPAFAQDPLLWTSGHLESAQETLEKLEQKQQFRENRKALIDKDGNPINGYDDKRTKEDEERETINFLKKVGNKIKSCFDAGVEWFENASKAQQAQQKRTNASSRTQKHSSRENSSKRTPKKKK